MRSVASGGGNEYSVSLRLGKNVPWNTFHQIVVLWMLTIVSFRKSILWQNKGGRYQLDKHYLGIIYIGPYVKYSPNILQKSFCKACFGEYVLFSGTHFFVSITYYLQ